MKISQLNEPWNDSALVVTVGNNSVNPVRIMLDCGANGLHRDVLKSIDGVLITHAHVDHFASVDSWVRARSRTDLESFVVGPPGITERFAHKLAAYEWDPEDRFSSSFVVWETGGTQIRATRFSRRTNFEAEPVGAREHGGYLMLPCDVKLRFAPVRHRETPCNAYALEHLGQRVAYVTDTLYCDETLRSLKDGLGTGFDELWCEACFFDEEERASERCHFTVFQTARLAKELKANKLYLVHLSYRYGDELYLQRHLSAARTIFPMTMDPVYFSAGGDKNVIPA
ncbi:hypothetical protein IJT17_09285 [bacterium]|nr:hypothetical protein [bacterium]